MDKLRTDRRQRAMAPEELDEQQVVDLPPREALSLVTTDATAVGDNVAMPINEATAINYQSNYSIAVADADQIVSVDQLDVDDTPTSDDGPVRGWGRGGRR